MSQLTWIDPRVARVHVADVRSYLLGRGWRLQPFPGPELLVFEGPQDDEGQPILQVLPASEHLKDYRMRVEGLIGALSIIEGRPAADILTDILKTTETNGAASRPTHESGEMPPGEVRQT